MRSDVNVANVERWASALGGAALTTFGIKQMTDRSPAGALLTAAGSALIYRGATGHCPVYAAIGVGDGLETVPYARDGVVDETREALSGRGGVLVEEAVTINAVPEDLYAFWRNFERLALFMDHIVAVECLDDIHSHWVVKAPGGRTVEWDAEVINEEPFQLIAWRTLSGSEVLSAGSVHFGSAGAERGAEVRVRLQYHPPAGKIGAAIAWMLGHDPSQTIREDLRRFKRLIETGEVATTDGQPHGARWL